MTRNFCVTLCHTTAAETVWIDPKLVGRCCTTRYDTKIGFCVNTPLDSLDIFVNPFLRIL
jgi:hypothetical protein